MSSEAVIIELFEGENPIRFTVADGTAIAKGSLLVLSDPNTAAQHAAGLGGVPFAGIAAAEKVASDGQTELAAHKRGIFDLKVSGSTCKAGDLLQFDAAEQNCVKLATAAQLISGAIVGKALEAASDPETIRVLVGGDV